MKDEILNEAPKIRRADRTIMNRKLKDEVSSATANMNGEFVELDDKVNDKIEDAEKSIKNGMNDDFKGIFHDESVDKKLETLTKNVKNLKTKKDKLEREIISVRNGVNNWIK